ncbi:MAG: mannose-6-phosphate isomerase [Chlamydiia bacterium]|nr:mannose-6-phosphate isomerase [Chlamydiia bacterium]
MGAIRLPFVNLVFMLYPLLFHPVYKDYIWGGARMRHAFSRKEAQGKIAESWEISSHPDGMSIVENGPLKGKTLQELFDTEKKALMGKHAHLEQFPLLLKIIDAQESLSVQVHPSTGKEAKTECWYLLDANPKSVVYAGLKENYSKETILEKLPTDDILTLMRTLPVQKGVMISIPGGRLHAIGAGCLIYEIQQTSNTTYRVYDWGRGRETHIEEAKQVMRFQDPENPRIPPKLIKKTETFTQTELLRTPLFVVEKWSLNGSIPWEQKENQCEFLFCISGNNSLVPPGRSLLLPAACPPQTIETNGCTLLRTFVP